MARLILVFVLCFFGAGYGAPGKLPSTFLRCSRSDANVNKCLAKGIQGVISEIFNEKGLPSLGIFPLDPLAITTLDIGNNDKSSVNIKLNFKDLKIMGLRNLVVSNVDSDINNYRMLIAAKTSQPLTLRGNYEADGRILILPIRGKGKCEMRLDNVNATLELIGKEKKKNGVKYMDIKNTIFHFTTTRLHLDFEGLFSTNNGNSGGQSQAVAETMNKFLNENWKEILVELQPAIEEAFGAAFHEIVTRLYSKVPYDDIYLK